VPEAHDQLIEHLIDVFPLREGAAAEGGGRSPVFICGMFRSGSTLAEQILARHSRITAGGELDFVPALVHGRLRPYPQSLSNASSALLDELREAYQRDLAQLFPSAALITDKRPDNFLHIGLTKAMFPNAKIIHTVRSPLDNILSIYFLHFHESVGYGFSLSDIVHWYRSYLRLMDHWKVHFPGDIHDLAYDDLVREPRRGIAAALNFLGLPWEEDVLCKTGAAAPVRTASVWQVRQPLHRRSSGRWRNYAPHLHEVAAALGIDLEREG
jgi:hypothetical protein